MPESELLRDRERLATAVQEAGAIAKKFFRNPLKHWTKGLGDSPVSEADIASNDLLQKRLVEPGEGWLSDHGVDYWSGPDSLPLWLPPEHEGFSRRSNAAAKEAGLVLRPWQETLSDTLDDERSRGLGRRRKAGLAPATEARLAKELQARQQHQ